MVHPQIESIFEDCRVPMENLLGRLNDGFRIAVGELAGGRIGVGSMALGIGLAAMDFATGYAKERVQFDDPIATKQAIQWMIADNYTRLEAARLLLLQAAFLKDSKKPFAKEASMAKLYATEAANRACYDAMQMLGGYGYTQDYPIERYYKGELPRFYGERVKQVPITVRNACLKQPSLSRRRKKGAIPYKVPNFLSSFSGEEQGDKKSLFAGLIK